MSAEQSNVDLLIEASPIAMLMVTEDGRILVANHQAELTFGYPRGDLVGRELDDLIPERFRISHPAFRAGFLAHPSARPMGSGRDLFARHSSGRDIPVEIGLSPVVVDGRRVVVAAVADITERKRRESDLQAAVDRRLEHLATHDPLTGLPTRNAFLCQTGTLTESAGSIVLLRVGVRGLARFNEALGSSGGDAILRELGTRLRGAAGPGAVVGRLSAPAFAVAIPTTGTEAGAELDPRVKAVLSVAKEPVAVEGRDIRVEVGIGMALYPEDAREPADLLHEAELAARVAHASSEDGPTRFRTAMLYASRQRVDLEQALTAAVEAGDLDLVFQPQVKLSDGEVVSVEALVRWEYDGVAVSPSDFIAIAEESNLIGAIGAWTLREGCREIAEMPGELRVAINVSPRQFLISPLVSLVHEVLEETGLGPSRLEIEVTEGTLMTDPTRSAEVLEGLRSLGVGVAIDDFGTGYSSLAYLSRFQFDTLKIDRSFVSRLGEDRADDAIVDAIIALAQSLDIALLAEGIETEAQAEHLRRRGCQVGQGFLFSPGLTRAELIDFIDAPG